MAAFVKTLDTLAGSRGVSEVFRSFATLAACAVAAGTREPEYLEEAKRWTPDELTGFSQAFGELVAEMDTAPFADLLGPAYMDTLGTKGQKYGGEFHTPGPVCELMARVTLAASPLPESGPITVCEPACGSGAMILALAGALPRGDVRRLRVTAIDINRTVCDLAFVNTTLWGIPCRVYHGNALSLEFHAAWSNLHHVCPWLAAGLRVPPQGAAPSVHETTSLTRALRAGQLDLNLAEARA